MERIERTLDEHPWLRRSIWALLVGGLIFFRLPERFLDPFLFAEEGRIYFRWAYHHDVLDSLRTTKLGYFSLWPNLATTLAAHAVPLELAPLVTTVLGTLVVLLMVLLLALPSSPLRGHVPRLVGAAALLLVPVHYGKVHTTFSMYYLSFCAALVLVGEASTARERWLHRGTLLLAGTTGSSSLFLAPLFLWKYLTRGRPRELLVQMGILFACGLLQIGALVHTARHFPRELPERWAPFEPGVLAGSVVARAPVAALGGIDAMRAFGEWVRAALFEGGGLAPVLVASACVLAYVLVLAAIAGPRGSRTPATRALALGFFLMTALSYASAATKQAGTKSALLVEHDRYFVAPCLILATAILLHAFAPQPGTWRRAYRVGLCWMLAAGAFAFGWQRPAIFDGGPSWRTELEAWRADPGRPLRVWPISSGWPDGWLFHLHPKRRARALAGEPEATGFVDPEEQ